MKKLSMLFALVMLISVAANAQEFKKFRWNLGLGYAIPSGTGAKGGVLVHSEPGYRVSDQLLVGLRMEFAGMVRGYSEGIESDIDVSFAGSYALTGQYYFNNNGFRPFVGAGVGIFSLASVSALTTEDGDVYAGASGSKIGFFPRVGFDAGHFNLALEYNLVGNSKLESLSGAESITSKNSYMSIKFGVFIGGGRK
jgi:hypothetical protein